MCPPWSHAIRQHGGFARIHCHGRVRNLLDMIVGMGADAIDPLEPPPHGDVTLDDVRQRYGRQLVLFGNLEVVDIERMDPAQFDTLVCRTLQQGTAGPGRGFVLMPSASPIGRTARAQHAAQLPDHRAPRDDLGPESCRGARRRRIDGRIEPQIDEQGTAEVGSRANSLQPVPSQFGMTSLHSSLPPPACVQPAQLLQPAASSLPPPACRLPACLLRLPPATVPFLPARDTMDGPSWVITRQTLSGADNHDATSQPPTVPVPDSGVGARRRDRPRCPAGGRSTTGDRRGQTGGDCGRHRP